jgi:flavin-binding protein dodecin
LNKPEFILKNWRNFMKRTIITMSRKLVFIGLFAILCASSGLAAPKVKHAIVGSIETVDKIAKTVAIKTADGTVETVKWTSKTTIRGLKDGAKAIDFAGQEGSHVVVHYTVKGAEKTAHTIEHLGRVTPKVMEGTIKVVGRGTRTMVVKTGDGVEETLELSEHAVVDSGKGIVDASKFTVKETEEGAKGTVYYSEEGGRKVARFIKHL